MRLICVHIQFLMVSVLLIAFPGYGQKKQAQNVALEQTIKRLDLEAAKAVLDRDEKGIARYFAAGSVTNNPRNGLTIGSAGVIDAARTGIIDYYKFERVVESVRIFGNTAITMGQETIVMKSPAGDPGTEYHRRYTNVWMRMGSTWQIVARHASVICGQ